MRNFIIILSLAFCSCSNSDKDRHQNSSSSIKGFEVTTKTSIADTFHFFQDCKLMKINRSIGGIQDTTADRDSSGYMGFYPCYSCKDSYEIIFALKGGKKARIEAGWDGIEKKFDAGCTNNFVEFECYSFVTPMRDPEKQPDMHALNIDFPTTVKIYKRITGNNWRFISNKKIKTVNDYCSMQLAFVYHKLY